MSREEVSSAPPPPRLIWGSVEEQSGTDLRWCARHILVTHGSCTFFSQSRPDLSRVLGTMMVLAKLANTSFLWSSIPTKYHMRGFTAAYHEPTAAAPRLLEKTRHTHQQAYTPLDNSPTTYRRRRLPTTTRTASVATPRRHRRRRPACDTGPHRVAHGRGAPGLLQRRPLPRRRRQEPE